MVPIQANRVQDCPSHSHRVGRAVDVYQTIFTAAVGVLAYYAQDVRRARLARELKALDDKVAADRQALQASLDSQVYQTNIRFEREFSIYQEIWLKVVSLRRAVFDLRPSSSYTTDETEEERFERKSKAFNDAHGSFVNVMDNNQPFYSAEIFKELERVRSIAAKEGFEYREQVDQGMQGNFSLDPFTPAEANRTDLLGAIDDTCRLIRSRFQTVGGQPPDLPETSQPAANG